jgi:hypothetical protein
MPEIPSSIPFLPHVVSFKTLFRLSYFSWVVDWTIILWIGEKLTCSTTINTSTEEAYSHE